MTLSNRFITDRAPIGTLDTPIAAPYFRKAFSLDFLPTQAEITICGLGFYELTVNGTDITKGPLAPYISNPDETVFYDTYDITSLLQKGENVIGILLGNGMRNPYGGFVWLFRTAKPCLALHLSATDGAHTLTLEADESFRTHPSPVLANDLRMTYCYDARRELPGWDKPGYDDSEWDYAQGIATPSGQPLLCQAEPIRVFREIAPISVTHYNEVPFAFESTLNDAPPMPNALARDAYLYDFGENNAGVTTLTVDGVAGQTITVRHLEYIQNGNPSINTISFDSPDRFDKYIEHGQKDVFICKGGKETFVPRFKYDGFRYALVEGLTPEQATLEALRFRIMSSDLAVRAGFSCSNDTVNKLQEMTQRADISNFYYFPTDCPHREKNGWTGDAQLSAEQILLNFDAANSLAVWLDTMRPTQTEEGIIPCIIPCGDWGYHHPPSQKSSGPPWDTVCISLPYFIYKFTGNTDCIRDNADMILRLLRYQRSSADENGLLGYGHGDWNDPFLHERKHFASPLRVTGTLAAYEGATRAAFLFGVIGRTEAQAEAQAFADSLLQAIRTKLIDFETMSVLGDCQTSQAMALECGIFREEERERACARLLQIIEKDGRVTTSGVIGLRYIFHALTSMGQWDLALELITCEKRPCYGMWVKLGATTLWETFPYENGFRVGSLNHHYMGDISSWFIQELGGIKPNPHLRDPNEFEISPVFARALSFANAHYTATCGTLRTEWKRHDGAITLRISVPEGMHGRLRLRGCDTPECELSGGDHCFTVKETEV